MTDPPPQAEAAESFYGAALARIGRFVTVLFVAGLPLVAYLWRVPGVIGYSVGGVLAYINFKWLQHGVEAIADRITEQGSRERGSSAVVKAFLRYALVGMGGYVIFESSEIGFHAFLVGLFLPVFGMLCEAAYELYGALRRGF
jgi:hypothetical protein